MIFKTSVRVVVYMPRIFKIRASGIEKDGQTVTNETTIRSDALTAMKHVDKVDFLAGRTV